MNKTLESILAAFGVSGNESEIKNVIKQCISNKEAEIVEDKMGNLIVKVGKGSEKLMMVAHMDEVGLMLTYIEDNGLLKAEKVGDFSEKYIGNSIVRFENDLEGVALFKENKTMIDMGFKDKAEAESVLREGKTAAFKCNYIENGNRLIGPKLDDRIGCYILLTLINELKSSDKEVYFVFSAQQRLGGRGARASANFIKPDKCIVIETQNVSEDRHIKLAHGPVVSVMDKSLIINHNIKEEIEQAANKKNITLQYAVSDENTDGGLIQKEGFGVKTGVVSVPCKYMNTLTEVVDMQDVETVTELLRELIK